MDALRAYADTARYVLMTESHYFVTPEVHRPGKAPRFPRDPAAAETLQAERARLTSELELLRSAAIREAVQAVDIATAEQRVNRVRECAQALMVWEDFATAAMMDGAGPEIAGLALSDWSNELLSALEDLQTLIVLSAEPTPRPGGQSTIQRAKPGRTDSDEPVELPGAQAVTEQSGGGSYTAAVAEVTRRTLAVRAAIGDTEAEPGLLPDLLKTARRLMQFEIPESRNAVEREALGYAVEVREQISLLLGDDLEKWDADSVDPVRLRMCREKVRYCVGNRKSATAWLEELVRKHLPPPADPKSSVYVTAPDPKPATTADSPPRTTGGGTADNEPAAQRADGAKSLPAFAEAAYQAYQLAVQRMESVPTDREAYGWLKENGPEGYQLPTYQTWSKYVRSGRNHYGTQKNSPRAGRTGSSTVRQDEI